MRQLFRHQAGIPAILIVLAVVFATGLVLARPQSDPLLFAAEMAGKGNWREAMFRWRNAEKADPDNPAILNNLAVALEVRGKSDEAAELYARIGEMSGEIPGIAYNIRGFNRFWDREIPVPPAGRKERKRPVTSKRSAKVEVPLPVPARLDVSGMGNILVASFLLQETDLLDINREIVRFLRSEFRRNTDLAPLDVSPAPPIPEQTLEALAANRKFWQHLGNRHGADLIVSGRVFYDRRESSGYEEVDTVSPVTGHKVRQTRFVEMEDFDFSVELLFLSGSSGELLFQDTVKRKMRFQGLNNDPITAFHQLSESIVGDVLSIVSPRRRIESRIIYKGRRP